MNDKQTIYSLMMDYQGKVLNVQQAAIDNWDDEYLNAAIEEREKSWKTLYKAVYFPGANDPAKVLANATLDNDEDIALATRQLSTLSAVIEQWPSRGVDKAMEKGINRYPGDSTEQEVGEAIEAKQLDRDAGHLAAAAGLVSAELDKRGLDVYRAGIEDKGTSGTLNPALYELARKQAREAFESDGLAVFITGNSDHEDGIRVYGPYPGEVTAMLLHHGMTGHAIALEPTSQFEDADMIRPADPRIDPNTCEFGWVNVYGAYDLATYGNVDGPWIDHETARKHVDGEVEVVTAPILGPVQFRP